MNIQRGLPKKNPKKKISIWKKEEVKPFLYWEMEKRLLFNRGPLISSGDNRSTS